MSLFQNVTVQLMRGKTMWFFFNVFAGRDGPKPLGQAALKVFVRALVEVKIDKSLIENLRYLQCWLHVKERIYRLGI